MPQTALPVHSRSLYLVPLSSSCCTNAPPWTCAVHLPISSSAGGKFSSLLHLPPPLQPYSNRSQTKHASQFTKQKVANKYDTWRNPGSLTRVQICVHVFRVLQGAPEEVNDVYDWGRGGYWKSRFRKPNTLAPELIPNTWHRECSSALWPLWIKEVINKLCITNSLTDSPWHWKGRWAAE